MILNREASEEYLKTFGYPRDIRCNVVEVEGACPAGYKVGDYIEYSHQRKELNGPNGICLHCLLHSGVLRIMEHLRGREWPHFMDRGVRSAEGELRAGKLCQCQGPEGPTVWW